MDQILPALGNAGGEYVLESSLSQGPNILWVNVRSRDFACRIAILRP